jgi:hypothetical protein
MTDRAAIDDQSGGAAPPPARSGSGWTGGRITGMVFSSLGGLIGIVMLLGGLALIADGYFSTDNERLRSPAYALTAEGLDLGGDPADWAPSDVLGTVRITVESAAGRPVFAGIGPTDDVDGYLGQVGHSEVTDFSDGSPTYDAHPGGSPATRPGDETFWVAESEGPGQQRVEWDVEGGDWSVVVMNADAARGVAVEADAGVKIGWVIWVGVGLAVVGLVLTAGCVLLILRIGRRAAAST